MSRALTGAGSKPGGEGRIVLKIPAELICGNDALWPPAEGAAEKIIIINKIQ